MKKLFALLLALCMIVSLAACGGGAAAPAATEAPKAEAPAATEAPAAEAPAEEPVTITFVRTGTPEILREIFEPIIADFEAEYPNIKIDMQDLGWGDATQSLQTWAASETLPDVMYHLPATIFDFADKGLIRDLTPYIDDELKNDMYASMFDAGKYNGGVYMITCGGSNLTMWYNAELFKQAGLDPDAPPKTWAELLAACEALSAIDGIAPLGVYANPSGGETSLVYESLFTSEFGGSAWDPDIAQYVYDSEEGKTAAVNALQFMQDMTKYAQEGYVEYGRFDVRTLLRDGKVAIVFDLLNMANQIPDGLADGTFRVAALPAGASGVQSSCTNVGGWYIPTNCEHPEEAWTFLRYLMNTETSYAHAAYGSAPMLKSEGALHTDGYMVDVIATMEDSYAEGVGAQTNALWTTTGEQLQLLLMGEQSAEETWQNISAEHGEVYE